MKLGLLGSVAAASLTLATSAFAADLPARTYTKAPPMVSPAYNWSGFYVGAHGGYAWSDNVTIGVTGFGSVSGAASDLNGGFGGGQIGYNWQFAPNVVLGIEADAAAASIRYSDSAFGITAETKIQALGSVTARLGYAINNVLLYGKGGWGWADNKLSVSALGNSVSDSQFHSGWTAGAGIEYGFAPNWSAKAEYQYYDLSNQTYFNALELGAKIHTVKGGLNYHFGWF
jgi:outer membrane immunogenic protein